jgi:hypothetical protein
MPLDSDAASRAVVRHLVATLAYRAAKVLRDVPADFATRQFGDSTRVPVHIVAHLADLMAWGVSLARGSYVWKPEGGTVWPTEVERFFTHLSTLDRELACFHRQPIPKRARHHYLGKPQDSVEDEVDHVG